MSILDRFTSTYGGDRNSEASSAPAPVETAPPAGAYQEATSAYNGQGKAQPSVAKNNIKKAGSKALASSAKASYSNGGGKVNGSSKAMQGQRVYNTTTKQYETWSPEKWKKYQDDNSWRKIYYEDELPDYVKKYETGSEDWSNAYGRFIEGVNTQEYNRYLTEEQDKALRDAIHQQAIDEEKGNGNQTATPSDALIDPRTLTKDPKTGWITSATKGGVQKFEPGSDIYNQLLAAYNEYNGIDPNEYVSNSNPTGINTGRIDSLNRAQELADKYNEYVSNSDPSAMVNTGDIEKMISQWKKPEEESGPQRRSQVAQKYYDDINSGKYAKSSREAFIQEIANAMQAGDITQGEFTELQTLAQNLMSEADLADFNTRSGNASWLNGVNVPGSISFNISGNSPSRPKIV